MMMLNMYICNHVQIQNYFVLGRPICSLARSPYLKPYFTNITKSFVIPVLYTAVFMHICVVPTAGNKIYEIAANV